LWVEILDCAARGASLCDGFGEVVRDGGARIEDHLANLPFDSEVDENALRQARYGELGHGVHRGDVVTLVCDDNRRLLVVEQHLVLGEVFQPAELADGRVYVAAGVVEVQLPMGLGVLVLVVDDVRSAGVDQGPLAVVVDDEVTLDQVGIEDLYHKNSFGRWGYT